MSLVKERHRIVVEKFQELLRSGKDYSVKYMCEEAGKAVYMGHFNSMKIINTHYKEIITQDMIDFVKDLDKGKIRSAVKSVRIKEQNKFSRKFGVCKRESILIMRYIRLRNGKG